jgi:hypothetical protein
MELLPEFEEREQLIAHTADVIARCGFAAYVSTPLLAPADRYFPDRWEPSERGLRRLTLRLLRYAGLDQLDPALILDGLEDPPLDDLDALVGLLARAVARAFLAERRLELDERLIDVATVYLGFGIFTVNNAYRYRSSGGLRGSRTVTQWSHFSAGVLSPQAMSFLLALHVLARDEDESEVARRLEPNQAACFRAALKQLRPLPSAPSALSSRLRLPPRAAWPAPPPLPPPPIGEDEAPATGAAALAEDQPPRSNEGRPVFRMRRRSAMPGLLGLFAGAAAAAILNSLGAVVLWLVAVGLVGGLYLGRRRRSDLCSKCEFRLALTAAECGFCGGVVRGEVRNRAELMDALETVEPPDAELEAQALAAGPAVDEDEERDY